MSRLPSQAPHGRVWPRRSSDPPRLSDVFFEAVRKGDTDKVVECLDRGVDMRCEDDLALRWAAQHGHAEIVALLLDRGARLFSLQYRRTLAGVAKSGDDNVVALLVDRGTCAWGAPDRALIRCALSGNVKAIAILIGLDRRDHARLALDEALMSAADAGRTETVALLLGRGADIHAQSDAALRGAASRGRTDTVELLLNRGADVHASQDEAVWNAAENGEAETVAMLLRRGADPTAKGASARRAALF